jgi:glutamate synthase (NADPH/NADH) small chain
MLHKQPLVRFHKKVYAGGDCQRGAHLAVTAAVDGREAAKAIIKELL